MRSNLRFDRRWDFLKELGFASQQSVHKLEANATFRARQLSGFDRTAKRFHRAASIERPEFQSRG